MQSDQMSGLPALLSQEPSQVSSLELCVHAACIWKQCRCDMTDVIICQIQLCLSLQLCRMKLGPCNHHHINRCSCMHLPNCSSGRYTAVYQHLLLCQLSWPLHTITTHVVCRKKHITSHHAKSKLAPCWQ